MAFYNVNSRDSSDTFREKIRRTRDLMHPDTVPKHRRTGNISSTSAKAMEFYKKSVEMQNSRKAPVEQNDGKSKLRYDEELFKKLLGK